MGRPDDAIIPALTLAGDDKPMCRVITLITKASAYSRVPEMQHIMKSINDPAIWREKALELFSEGYFQNVGEFSDILSAVFPPGSPGSAAINTAGICTLAFEGYGQRFDLYCRVSALSEKDSLFQASWCHNRLFNPKLNPKAIVLCFRPDWSRSGATPAVQDNLNE